MATEKRLIIFADDLIKCLEKHDRKIPGIPWSITGIRNILKELKPVDAVEVVRCKDCKHYDNSEGLEWCHLNSGFYTGGIEWHSFPEDGYCSYGERKDND